MIEFTEEDRNFLREAADHFARLADFHPLIGPLFPNLSTDYEQRMAWFAGRLVGLAGRPETDRLEILR